MTTNKLTEYYHLTKPGIIRGNFLTASAGFLFASKNNVNLLLMAEFLSGIILVIASACVLNNIIDRSIDKRMQRTQKRALVTGQIKVHSALIYGIALGLTGFGLLGLTNLITFVLGVIAITDYLLAYGYFKRHSSISTLVGTIAGALPPAAGYTAVTGRLDLAAALLFLTMTWWQMAHFYSIGIYRRREYAAAKLPILSVTRGADRAKLSILSYILAYMITAPLLAVLGYASLGYGILALILAAYWLYEAIKDFDSPQTDRWARKMFGVSLLVVTGWCLALALPTFAPLLYNSLMVLTLHISVALVSIVLLALTYSKPSNSRLWTAYTSVALTLASGIYLIIIKPSALAHVCVMGLIYTSVATYYLVGVHRKLATI